MMKSLYFGFTRVNNLHKVITQSDLLLHKIITNEVMKNHLWKTARKEKEGVVETEPFYSV